MEMRSVFLLLLCCVVVSGEAYAGQRCDSGSVKGIFSSHPGRGDAVLNDPQVRGVLVRTEWERIEPELGRFDFSSIDRQVEKMRSHGKQWSLAVLAGPHSPEWMRSSDAYDPFVVRSPRFGDVTLPAFWNSNVQNRLSVLSKALSKRYGADKSLKVVYVPQMTVNGVEGHFNGISDDVLKKAGLTNDRWTQAVYQSTLAFASAFPEQAVVVELHEIYRSIDIPKSIVETLYGDKRLKDQVGFGIWWLSGKDNYQGALLRYLGEQTDAPLYGQLIGHSGQSRRFGQGGLVSALKQAQDMGMAYVEAWNYEFENHTSDALFGQFNEWADAYCQ